MFLLLFEPKRRAVSVAVPIVTVTMDVMVAMQLLTSHVNSDDLIGRLKLSLTSIFLSTWN